MEKAKRISLETTEKTAVDREFLEREAERLLHYILLAECEDKTELETVSVLYHAKNILTRVFGNKMMELRGRDYDKKRGK